MNKRGISQVITMVLIILLVLVAIATIWAFIRPVINKGVGDISISQFTISMEIVSPTEVDYLKQEVIVKVRRNAGQGDVTAINVILEDSEGNSKVFRNEVAIEELETKTLTVDYSGSGLLDDIVEIAIAPIFSGPSGNEITGNILGETQEFDESFEGIVGYWNFNGNTDDQSGKGNHGNIFGGVNCTVVASGIINEGCDFDGDDDYVDVPSLDWQPDKFTVAWWHYPESQSDFNQPIGALNSWGAYMFHTTVAGAIFVGIDSCPGCRLNATELPPGTLELNAWQHFTFTFDNGVGSFYKDGGFLASKNTMPNPTSWGSFRMGTTGLFTINGKIDEVRIYNRALSASEVQALCEHDKGAACP